jgi:hypothetical protein
MSIRPNTPLMTARTAETNAPTTKPTRLAMPTIAAMRLMTKHSLDDNKPLASVWTIGLFDANT